MALRIKEICKQKGISMGEIAERIGISPVNLSASINGNPTLNRLQEVADILGVDVSDLFGRTDKPKIYGYLEVNGKPCKIDSVDALRRLLTELNGALESNK